MSNPIPSTVSIVGELEPVPVSVVDPGASYQGYVQLNEVTTTEQTVTIGSSAGTFSSCPTTVAVAANTDSVYFPLTVSTTASGTASLSAGCNGKTIFKRVPVQNEGTMCEETPEEDTGG